MIDQVLGRIARPSAAITVVVTLLLLAADSVYRHVGGDGITAGLLDETAHLMTGALILGALFRGADADFSLGLLAGSVLIDADHIPNYLGDDFLTKGTSRPYTHSLITVAVVLVVALVWQRRRMLLLGAAVGLIGHFYRDTAETRRSGVPLLWPWSYDSYNSPHWLYLLVMGVLAVIALARARNPSFSARRR